MEERRGVAGSPLCSPQALCVCVHCQAPAGMASEAPSPRCRHRVGGPAKALNWPEPLATHSDQRHAEKKRSCFSTKRWRARRLPKLWPLGPGGKALGPPSLSWLRQPVSELTRVPKIIIQYNTS